MLVLPPFDSSERSISSVPNPWPPGTLTPATPNSRHSIKSSGSRPVSRDQAMASRPPGSESAPYLRALVASSCSTRPSCTAMREVEHDDRTGGGDARVGRAEVDLLADQIGQFRPLHLALHQQIVRPRQRLQAPGEAGDEGAGARLGPQRLAGDRLDRGKRVLHPVVELAQQQSLPLLARLALGDVARDLGGADHVPGAVADRRHGQRDEQPPPALGHPHGVEMLDPLAAPHAGEDRVLFRQPLLRDDATDVLPDHLLRM